MLLKEANAKWTIHQFFENTLGPYKMRLYGPQKEHASWGLLVRDKPIIKEQVLDLQQLIRKHEDYYILKVISKNGLTKCLDKDSE